MNNSYAISLLKNMLPERISESELNGTPSVLGLGKMVYADPEPYAIEHAIKSIEKLDKIINVIVEYNTSRISKSVAYDKIVNIMKGE